MVIGSHQLPGVICAALGLKNVRSFHLHMAVNSIVSVKAEYFPEEKELKRLGPIFMECELSPKKKDREAGA